MQCTRHNRSEALERFGLLNVQWQQLEMELRLLLRHYLVHPISVNQSNAAVLPIMLSSKPLPEMEAQETALAAELYQTARLEGLPQEQQLARLMVASVEAGVVQTVRFWLRFASTWGSTASFLQKLTGIHTDAVPIPLTGTERVPEWADHRSDQGGRRPAPEERCAPRLAEGGAGADSEDSAARSGASRVR